MLRIVMLPLLAPLLFANVHLPPDYVSEVEKWRIYRETRLKADNGWLTLVGLSWLKEGENSVGTSDNDQVVLPKGKMPDRVGTITLHNGAAHIELRPDVHARINGQPATSADLKPDTTGKPDLVQIGSVTFYLIHRGTKDGIRVKDNEAETRRDFTGLKWYPVDKKWRIVAKWVAFDKPQKLVMDSMVGEKEEGDSPGYAVFTLNGQEYKLQPTEDGDDLEFVFKDKTAGKTTYPAARFLDTEKPSGDTIVLDFNKAYNPPCAFTSYATCPLPIPQNRLPIPIPAGEKMYGHGH